MTDSFSSGKFHVGKQDSMLRCKPWKTDLPGRSVLRFFAPPSDSPGPVLSARILSLWRPEARVIGKADLHRLFLCRKLIAAFEATVEGILHFAKVWSAWVSWGCNKRTSAEGGKMTAFQGIFLSEGTPEGRGPQPQDTPAGRAARSHECTKLEFSNTRIRSIHSEQEFSEFSHPGNL